MGIFSDFHQIHLRAVGPRELDGAQIILILRDPLARFASAYKWSKYRGVHFKGGATSKQIWDCFPTLAHLGEHCLDDTRCGRLLRREVQSPQHATYHMGMGYRYYLQNVDLDQYRDHLHVVEQEQLGDDFNRAISHILGFAVNITLPIVHSEYPQKDDFIPARYHGNVKEMLREEYAFYEEIKEKYAQ